MSPQVEIQLVGSLVAVACALPGAFLVLRQMALMSDAISHSILLGIVLGFFVVADLGHPLLVVMAGLSGLLTVYLTEVILKTRLVKADAAIGLVFPVMFSLGVILISRFASTVHLDIDAVLLGEIAFAPFNRREYFGLDLPQGVWVMGGMMLLNVTLITAFYKELKLATFDTELAAALGFAPVVIHYGLMSIVSVTAVGAFEHVGSILVVALMIAPPAAAYLITNSLSRMLVLSALIGVLSAVSGYWLARVVDTNIAGAMATMTGFFFILALLLAPHRGLLARRMERIRRRERFAVEMLVVHLSRHENSPAAAIENSIDHLLTELNWKPSFAQSTVEKANRDGLVERDNDQLLLTNAGRSMAARVLAR